jgi:hypothetical protein
MVLGTLPALDILANPIGYIVAFPGFLLSLLDPDWRGSPMDAAVGFIVYSLLMVWAAFVKGRMRCVPLFLFFGLLVLQVLGQWVVFHGLTHLP